MNTIQLIEIVAKRERLAAELAEVERTIARAAEAADMPAPTTASTAGTAAPPAPTATNPPTPAGEVTGGPGARGASAKIVRWIERHPRQEVNAEMVSKEARVKIGIVRTVLNRLHASGRLTRVSKGVYKLAASHAPAA